MSSEYDDLYDSFAHARGERGRLTILPPQAARAYRVEISSKFRREQFELEAAQAGLRVESWWTDSAGDFAVALVLRDVSAGS